VRCVADSIWIGLSIYNQKCAVLADSASVLLQKGVSCFLAVGLSALLKLLSTASTASLAQFAVSKHRLEVLLMIVALETTRRAHMTNPSMADEVPRQVLALQCLLQVAVRFSTVKRDSHIRSAVLSKLAVAIDSPSYAVRKVAVRVRNIWSVTQS